MYGVKVEGLVVGQRALAIGSGDHYFRDGEAVKFVRVFNEDEDEKFYGYEFINENGLHQTLESFEFELIK